MEIVECNQVTSTNDELKKLAEKGAKPFTVVVAKKQTAGRGRYNRQWESGLGNLFISVLTRPTKNFSELSLVAGLAVFASVKKFTAAEVKLKWPNDVLLNGKKLAGILLEKVGDKIIVGVGINIASAPSYAVYLEGVTAKQVQEVFLYNFQKYYDEWEQKGFYNLRQEWLQNAAFLNQEITIKLADQEMRGVFEGINNSGEMLLNGRVINSGEIFG